MIRIRTLARATLPLLLCPAPLAAQSIDDAVRSIDDGQVRMSFAAREGVCGNGEHHGGRRHTADWEGTCDNGPVRVVLHVRAGVVADIDMYLGGRWRARDGAIRDLATVSTADAADYLLRLAAMRNDDVGRDALPPAALADSVVVWPRLLGIARDGQVAGATREAAIFWLSVAAGEAAAADLSAIAADRGDIREVREAALFALSRLPGDTGLLRLLDIARASDDPELRRHAMFWLGQTGDPRALAFFEEILANDGTTLGR